MNTRFSSPTLLNFTTLEVPAALIGPENPFPQLLPPSKQTFSLRINNNVPESMRVNIGYGVGSSPGDPCFPYALQDQYTRERTLQPLKVAVLENEHLKAVFLMEYGARLWSLTHKATGRELVEVNTVFQPANLAIRDAWFSGGIEWNCGVRGHTPLGCEPLHAAKLQHPGGWPVLRVWEFERIRSCPFQIDFLLPPESEFLHVRIGLFNPHETTVPFYWWTNIAVSETPGVRVIAPADNALRSGYSGDLQLVSIPRLEETDITYPEQSVYSSDTFFNIPSHSRPWIASLDSTGTGLIQSSTDQLRGRKLFVWGRSPGGQQWQRFLSEEGRRYFEIQAGVARTQYESFPFPGRSRMAWIETFGLLQIEPKIAHHASWKEAVEAIDFLIADRLSNELGEGHLDEDGPFFDQPPDEIVQLGSGWGALECRRREKQGKQGASMPGSPFPTESLGLLQEPWLQLLENGKFTDGYVPASWMLQNEWTEILDRSGDDSWLTDLHRGLVKFQQGDLIGARLEWQRGLEKDSNVWLLRNLAQLERYDRNFERALALFEQAFRLGPSLTPLIQEFVECLLEANSARQALDFLGRLPKELTASGRLRVLRARAALGAGELDLAESMLGEDLVVPNLREGEGLLHDLWLQIRAQREIASGCSHEEAVARVKNLTIPPHLDFRQSAL